MAEDNWGTRGRFGIFIVGNEAVPEAEWWAMAPPGVSIHAARITAPAPWAPWAEGRKGVRFSDDLARGVAQFGAMTLDAVVIAHSSSSVAGGAGWDAAAIEAVSERLPAGTEVTTNGLDLTLALQHLDVARPFLVFPPWFNDATVKTGVAYFDGLGFAPTATRHVTSPEWDGVPPEQLYPRKMHMSQRTDQLLEQILAECPKDADGVVLVGTGLRCCGIIDAAEAALGRPVITANQASLWRCLYLAGIAAPIEGYGRLLRGGAGG